MTGSTRPNILMITARADFGGGPEHIYRLINTLSDKVNFFIACPDDFPYWDLYSKIIGTDNMMKIPHRKFKFASLKELSLFTKRNKIKIVHSHGKGAGIYSRLLAFTPGLKCIHTFHGIHLGHYNTPGKKVYLLLEKFLSLSTQQYISVSESERQTVVNSGITTEEKIKLIPNGTPLQSISLKTSQATGEYRIASITRFDFAKNTSLLIPIALELNRIGQEKQFKFTIIGSGKEEGSFRNQITSLNIEHYFELTGSILNPGDYLIKSFCYISTSRWEGLPLGVLEAMSYGLPVVATAVSGNTDLVEHEANGFLYDLNRPEDAASYIMQLANDEEKYKRFAKVSRSRIENEFSINKMAEETLNLYLTI